MVYLHKKFQLQTNFSSSIIEEKKHYL